MLIAVPLVSKEYTSPAVNPLIVTVPSLPGAQDVGFTWLTIAIFGTSFTTTFTQLDALVHPATSTVKQYVPGNGFDTIGFCCVLLKPFGPLQV